MALALAWPWAVPKVLGLKTCGLINITGGHYVTYTCTCTCTHVQSDGEMELESFRRQANNCFGKHDSHGSVAAAAAAAERLT